MTGSGKYAEEAARLRTNLQAQGIVLIVCRGNKGDGFEVQINPDLAALIPVVLMEVALKMQADIHNLTTTPNPAGN